MSVSLARLAERRPSRIECRAGGRRRDVRQYRTGPDRRGMAVLGMRRRNRKALLREGGRSGSRLLSARPALEGTQPRRRILQRASSGTQEPCGPVPRDRPGNRPPRLPFSADAARAGIQSLRAARGYLRTPCGTRHRAGGRGPAPRREEARRPAPPLRRKRRRVDAGGGGIHRRRRRSAVPRRREAGRLGRQPNDRQGHAGHLRRRKGSLRGTSADMREVDRIRRRPEPHDVRRPRHKRATGPHARRDVPGSHDAGRDRDVHRGQRRSGGRRGVRRSA